MLSAGVVVEMSGECRRRAAERPQGRVVAAGADHVIAAPGVIGAAADRVKAPSHARLLAPRYGSVDDHPQFALPGARASCEYRQSSVTRFLAAEHLSQTATLRLTISTQPSAVKISSTRGVGTPVRATKHVMHRHSVDSATMTSRRSLALGSYSWYTFRVVPQTVQGTSGVCTGSVLRARSNTDGISTRGTPVALAMHSAHMAAPSASTSVTSAGSSAPPLIGKGASHRLWRIASAECAITACKSSPRIAVRASSWRAWVSRWCDRLI